MSTLFSVPTTPSSQSRSSRSRYNSDTKSTHSQSYPSNIDPTLTQTPTPTHTQPRHHTNSVSSVRSQKTPRGTFDYHNNITGSPLAASPTQDNHTRTPFVQSAVPPSPHLDRQPGSPTQMPTYHPSPSPTATYGINGGLIVNSNASTMPSGNGAECQPLLPNQPDVFMNGKTGRPALRPAHSHNTVLTPTSVNWNRRSGAEDPNSAHRPTTTESVYTTQQGTEHGHQQHEASAPFSHPQSVATHSSYPPAPPSSQQQHHSSSHTHTQSMPITSGTPYSDPEAPFQSTSYAGSYDSSYGPNSPWLPPNEGSYSQYTGGYHANMPANRVEEPILAPGEVPAPRPPSSYAALIGEALLLAPPPHQLYVSEISESIKRRYVYYRQNPTKVYNGVRHQTSMCKAFVKLSRPYGDQSGGARKWAIRAGCETWFVNGGCRQPTAGDLKKSMSPPPGKPGKAKATARAKQLAIGTNAYHNYNRSPKMSYKVKQEPYTPASGPSVGPAYDGRSSYPYHQYYPGQTHQPNYPPGYHYVPMQGNPNYPHPHAHAHPMSQNGWSHQNGGYQAQAPPPHPVSPSEDASPIMTPAAGHSVPHPYSTHAYPQPPQNQYWTAPPQGDFKPYASMPPPSSHPYHQQSDERAHGHQEQHSPASYEGHSPQGMRGRDDSAELSPSHQ